MTFVTGNSVLHIAAQNGRPEIIDELLLKGADVNKVRRLEPQTPMDATEL